MTDWTAREVLAAIRPHRPAITRSELRRLVRRGSLRRTGRGTYDPKSVLDYLEKRR